MTLCVRRRYGREHPHGSAQGHEARFPPAALNGRCRFSEPTLAGALDNGSDAPQAAKTIL
jgi:hypothetical protein